jgi:hypothetical protein
MRLTFTVETNNFLDAAAIEETLKKNELKYTVDVCQEPLPVDPLDDMLAGFDATPEPDAKPYIRRARIDQAKVDEVLNEIVLNPSFSNRQIAAICNISSATTDRIRLGIQALQVAKK